MAKIGKYELVRRIAIGGTAEVHLARFEWAGGLEKTIVVKRILPHLAEDASFIEMFFSEAKLAAHLSHPNIAQIIEFGESDGVHFLAMEYVDGPTLRALLNAAHAPGGGGLPFPHCARIAAFCCEALTYAHELADTATGQPLNLVHRDVSPDNILLSRTGSVKLVDFGIAKAATQKDQTRTGLVKGKLAYMSPEQIRAQPLDRRADIFSLGVVLYEMVAGARPYDSSGDVTLVHAMLFEPMVPLHVRCPEVPPALERIVNRALEPDRDKRYASCRQMHADLEEYLLSSRQVVSALQLANLVEQARPGKVEAAPGHPGQQAKRPEPQEAQPGPAADRPVRITQAVPEMSAADDRASTVLVDSSLTDEAAGTVRVDRNSFGAADGDTLPPGMARGGAAISAPLEESGGSDASTILMPRKAGGPAGTAEQARVGGRSKPDLAAGRLGGGSKPGLVAKGSGGGSRSDLVAKRPGGESKPDLVAKRPGGESKPGLVARRPGGVSKPDLVTRRPGGVSKPDLATRRPGGVSRPGLVYPHAEPQPRPRPSSQSDLAPPVLLPVPDSALPAPPPTPPTMFVPAIVLALGLVALVVALSALIYLRFPHLVQRQPSAIEQRNPALPEDP